MDIFSYRIMFVELKRGLTIVDRNSFHPFLIMVILLKKQKTHLFVLLNRHI